MSEREKKVEVVRIKFKDLLELAQATNRLYRKLLAEHGLTKEPDHVVAAVANPDKTDVTSVLGKKSCEGRKC